MTARKLSQLPGAGPLTGSETLPAVQSGATVAATAAAIAALYGPRQTLTATVDPGPGDDAADGYAAGSVWFNAATGVTWRCRDPAAGAAVWVAHTAHSHAIGDTTGLQTALDGKAATEHAHTVLRTDTLFVEPPAGGTVDIDASRGAYFVSAFGGPVTLRLPAAGTAGQRWVLVKKTDVSANAVTVTLAAGGGPDAEAITLAAYGHGILVISDGNQWFIAARHAGAAQPLDADLTALAALTGTGLCERTGDGTAALRTIGTGSSTAIPDRQAADARYAQLAGATMTGVLSVTTGTAAAPALAIAGDPDTGLYQPSAGSLAVSVDGVLTARFNYSGNTRDLSVGTTTTSRTRLAYDSVNGTGTIGADSTGGSTKFRFGTSLAGVYSDWLEIASDGTTKASALLTAETASGVLAGRFYRKTSTATDNIVEFRSDNGSTNELKGAIDADGTPRFDNALATPAADYADMMESADGLPIPIGTSVVLDGAKVRPATAADLPAAIIGVVRPPERCAVLGNQAWREWRGKWVRDAYGRRQLAPVAMVRWTEVDAETDSPVKRVHEVAQLGDTVPPPDAAYFTAERAILSPDYDPSRPYVPRIERPEWHAVGLVGIVELARGQPTGDRWHKLRTIDAETDQWLVR